jgi:hypothetical protein
MMRKSLPVCLFALLLVCGCGNPIKPPEPPPEPPKRKQWEIELEQLQSVIKVGMTQAEVRKAAGEPQYVRSIVGMVSRVTWEYSLPSEKRFIVNFDEKGRVAEVELFGAKKVTP